MVDGRHTTDSDKAFEILMTWKVFTAEDTSVTSLLRELAPLKLDVNRDIEEIISTQEKKINHIGEGMWNHSIDVRKLQLTMHIYSKYSFKNYFIMF